LQFSVLLPLLQLSVPLLLLLRILQRPSSVCAPAGVFSWAGCTLRRVRSTGLRRGR
jgi:hypothetical protein